jgi:hypothetical protein
MEFFYLEDKLQILAPNGFLYYHEKPLYAPTFTLPNGFIDVIISYRNIVWSFLIRQGDIEVEMERETIPIIFPGTAGQANALPDCIHGIFQYTLTLNLPMDEVSRSIINALELPMQQSMIEPFNTDYRADIEIRYALGSITRAHNCILTETAHHIPEYGVEAPIGYTLTFISDCIEVQ